MPFLRADLSVMHRNLSSRQGETRQSGNLMTLEHIVINDGFLRAHRDLAGNLRVPDHHIGIAAHIDQAKARSAR